MIKQTKVICVGGYGHSCQVLDELLEMPEARFIGFSPAYPGEDLTMIKNHKICTQSVKEYLDIDTMLKQSQADVAIVSSRLDMIAESVIRCAQAHCHIIAEKPLSLTFENLKRVHTAVKNNNVKIMAMLTMRSFPAFIAAAKIYKSGIIGDAVLANVRKSYRWGVRPDWFGERDKYGTTIGWIGIHAFDILNFITGLEYKTVAAMQSNFSHPSHRHCEDNCVIAGQLTNGGHFTASIDFFRPEDSQVHGDDWIRLVGTKGIIEAAASRNICTVQTNDGEQNVPLPPGRKIYKEFIESVFCGNQTQSLSLIPFMLNNVCLYANQSAEQKALFDVEHKWL